MIYSGNQEYEDEYNDLFDRCVSHCYKLTPKDIIKNTINDLFDIIS